jgi:asparagine synthase (glutamine-hydrolysing)
MCGICGFSGPPDRGTIERMTLTMVHRGPDSQGLWEAPTISLGMRRLAIIDLESGQQPAANEDGGVQVVFNGEIYNHVELRAELEARGHRFRSDHSDTEVLVHLYEEHGPDYLHRLNGMFAIALWDGKREELHLARDHAGIKPLYFTFAAGRLVFGSEIKALLAHPDVRVAPNVCALHHYFTFKNIPAPWSAVAGIEQLRPGERAVLRDGVLHRERWWRLRFVAAPHLDEATAAPRIRELLTDSIRLRMRTDVPFGAYLSGGLDSSSVVALMSSLGARRIKTFSLVYADDFAFKAADRHYAQLISELYDTEHYEYVLTSEEVARSAEAVLQAFDEPFSGVTSTYFLTQLIARHVKVALSGDGADELFGSYLPHRLAQPLYYYSLLQGRLDRLSAAERDLLVPFAQKPELLAAIAARGDEAARRMAQYLWTDCEKDDLYTDSMRSLVGEASSEALVRELYDAAGTEDPLNRALQVDFESLLPDQVLAFVDRLSMAHAVEVRPPFLDHRLMELSATLPGAMKIKRGRVKHILKEAVRGLIPDEVIDRPKEGFVLPINDWLLGTMREFLSQTLTPSRLARHGLLRAEPIQRLVTEHYAGRANHGARLWTLMMFQLWWERYFG